MRHTSQQLLGAHVSIAGSFCNAIIQGEQIGCTAIQIFTKSNRQWASKPITQEERQEFLDAQKNSKIKLVVAHACYLINLASDNLATQEKSYAALVDEIQRCDQLQIPYLVLHPGAAVQHNKELAILQAAKLIDHALQQTSSSKTTVLIETMAGQGTTIGSTFKELGMMLEKITNKQRIGICFDTCHAFVAGYDFRDQQKYQAVFDDFDAKIGLEYLKMFHMNDSKKEYNSHVDRHENIGQGALGLQAFALIMNDQRFAAIPKILETPKSQDDLQADKENLMTLQNLILD